MEKIRLRPKKNVFVLKLFKRRLDVTQIATKSIRRTHAALRKLTGNLIADGLTRCIEYEFHVHRAPRNTCNLADVIFVICNFCNLADVIMTCGILIHLDNKTNMQIFLPPSSNITKERPWACTRMRLHTTKEKQKYVLEIYNILHTDGTETHYTTHLY